MGYLAKEIKEHLLLQQEEKEKLENEIQKLNKIVSNKTVVTNNDIEKIAMIARNLTKNSNLNTDNNAKLYKIL